MTNDLFIHLEKMDKLYAKIFKAENMAKATFLRQNSFVQQINWMQSINLNHLQAQMRIAEAARPALQAFAPYASEQLFMSANALIARHASLMSTEITSLPDALAERIRDFVYDEDEDASVDENEKIKHVTASASDYFGIATTASVTLSEASATTQNQDSPETTKRKGITLARILAAFLYLWSMMGDYKDVRENVPLFIDDIKYVANVIIATCSQEIPEIEEDANALLGEFLSSLETLNEVPEEAEEQE